MKQQQTKLLIIPPSREHLHISTMNRWIGIWPVCVAEFFPQFWRNWKWLPLQSVQCKGPLTWLYGTRVEFQSFYWSTEILLKVLNSGPVEVLVKIDLFIRGGDPMGWGIYPLHILMWGGWCHVIIPPHTFCVACLSWKDTCYLRNHFAPCCLLLLLSVVKKGLTFGSIFHMLRWICTKVGS